MDAIQVPEDLHPLLGSRPNTGRPGRCHVGKSLQSRLPRGPDSIIDYLSEG